MNYCIKLIIIIFVLSFSNHSVSEGYVPMIKSVENFKGHYLYPLFIEAINSSSISDALINWENIVNNATDSGEPTDLEDLTHYELYRIALSELSRVYYINGDIEEGDRVFLQHNSISTVQIWERYIELSCKN